MQYSCLCVIIIYSWKNTSGSGRSIVHSGRTLATIEVRGERDAECGLEIVWAETYRDIDNKTKWISISTSEETEKAEVLTERERTTSLGSVLEVNFTVMMEVVMLCEELSRLGARLNTRLDKEVAEETGFWSSILRGFKVFTVTLHNTQFSLADSFAGHRTRDAVVRLRRHRHLVHQPGRGGGTGPVLPRPRLLPGQDQGGPEQGGPGQHGPCDQVSQMWVTRVMSSLCPGQIVSASRYSTTVWREWAPSRRIQWEACILEPIESVSL